MATAPQSVRNAPLVSDVAIRDTLRRELQRSLSVEKRFSRGSLAQECGVDVSIIDTIISRDPGKHRRLKIDDVFSLAAVLGTRAVNALTATISFGAYRLDEGGSPDLTDIVASGLVHMAVIAEALRDHRIDPHEEGAVTDAADGIIDAVTPLSSRFRA